MRPLSREQFVERFADHPLDHLPALRHPRLFGDRARYWANDADTEAMIHFPRAISRSDIEDYPDAETVTIGETGASLDELVASLAPGRHVLKVGTVVTDPRLTETQRFVSLTTDHAPAVKLPPDGIVAEVEPSDAVLALCRLAHWKDDDLRNSVASGARLFALGSVSGLRAPQAACLVHQAWDTIWEIGALGVAPDDRGRGFARTLVGTVTRRLLAEGKVPRYHVNAANAASLAVAQACGYTPFMDFRHYRFTV
jgi:GNAT superfamily N-acetyltransferase